MTLQRLTPSIGKRSYSARAYVAPNAHRSNLHILCEATVSAVKLDEDRATGVSFVVDGHQYMVTTKREVIVSCGTIQSPQILELSGIGNPDILAKSGVKCRVENGAVGENYQDHVAAVGQGNLRVHRGRLTDNAL